MATLGVLLRDLERALASGDLDSATAVRRTLVAGYPEAPEAAEASYRLGLEALFRRRQVSEAEDHLRRATKLKHPTWSLPARVSLGLLLLHSGRPQQAVFELRRAASVTPASVVSAHAKALLAVALYKSQSAAEGEKIRAECKQLLARLCGAPDPQEAALASWMLGMELKFDGDRAGARGRLQAALDSGQLPAVEAMSARTALASL